ncbi:hypothetical protein V8C86DRAFT_3031103, partial [Haematococcus lacustris]
MGTSCCLTCACAGYGTHGDSLESYRQQQFRPDSWTKGPLAKLVVSAAPTPGRRPAMVELNAVHYNPARPWLFAVGGGDPRAFVYDVRRLVKAGEAFRLSERAACRVSQGYQPVAQLCPDHLEPTVPGADNFHITCVRFNQAGQLLSSYSHELCLCLCLPKPCRPPGCCHCTHSGDGHHAVLNPARPAAAAPSPGSGKGYGASGGTDTAPCAPGPDPSLQAASPCPDPCRDTRTSTGHCHLNCQTVKGVNFFGSEEDYVISGSDCGHIFTWDRRSGRLLRVMMADEWVVNCLEPHPLQALVLASSGIQEDIKIWGPTAPEPQSTAAATMEELLTVAAHVSACPRALHAITLEWSVWVKLQEVLGGLSRHKRMKEEHAELRRDIEALDRGVGGGDMTARGQNLLARANRVNETQGSMYMVMDWLHGSVLAGRRGAQGHDSLADLLFQDTAMDADDELMLASDEDDEEEEDDEGEDDTDSAQGIKLWQMGFKQEMPRTLSLASNAACAVSVMSCWTTGATFSAQGLAYGGPVAVIWGWLLVSCASLAVAACLAELVSAFPTSGGLYYWTFVLAPARHRAIACWMTGWLSLLGNTREVAFTASTELLLAQYLAALIVFSGFWQVVATLAFCALLIAVAPGHTSPNFAFGTWLPNTELTGLTNPVHIFLVGVGQGGDLVWRPGRLADEPVDHHGVLVLQLCSMHLLCVVMLPVLAAGQTRLSSTGCGLQVAWDVFKARYGQGQAGLAVLYIPAVGLFMCGANALTSSSRAVYAFSRDGAMLGSAWWHRLSEGAQQPWSCIWLMACLAVLAALPAIFNPQFATALSATSVVALSLSYLVPIALALWRGDAFLRGAFSLGSWSR